MSDLRVFRTPFSTNVERIAMAAAFKRLEVEWIDVDPDDRRVVRELSGQDLVPVAVVPAEDGAVITDSMRILTAIEARWSTPALWPDDPGAAALVDVFCRRFNDLWKGPPNRLAALLGTVDFDIERLSAGDRRAVEGDTQRLRTWLDRFEERLGGQGHLGGDAFGIADVTAYPFLRYGIEPPAAADRDPFHRVLHELGGFDATSHPRLTAWCGRVAARFK